MSPDLPPERRDHRPARTEIGPPPDMTAAASLDGAAADDTTAHEPPADETAPAPTPLAAGSRVAQFEIIRELGRGGMGRVFQARDTRLGRLVALKVVGLRSAGLVERFLVEARATARCTHENIVVIYEVDEWQGQPYMALEYLEGEPLSKLQSGRPMPPRRAVELMVPVVRALVRAHELGIVHRDLKPDNIFVTRTGLVKVLDFGIAKLFGGPELTPRSPAALADDDTASRMTQQGAFIGTMPYMAPEQWGSDAVDHRADLWAVGIILWELLAGRHPLAPLTRPRLVHAAAMLDEPMPGIAEAEPDVPGELERIVDRCLAKPKADRYESARELLEALERLVPGRFGRRLDEDDGPYPGMSSFQEGDADRFFGRGRDVEHLVQRMREMPLLGVAGASGVGKSSLIRAGVIPALKASDESWEVFITRPGRTPLAGLATLLQPLTRSGSAEVADKLAEHQALVDRLHAEPGYLGTLLRSRARQKDERILLFVDQFEELYTLVADADERRAYTACLAGVADDPSTPLRVVVSMRSDFLDRAAEDRAFLERLTSGLVFLPPVDRAGMADALVQPAEMAGYAFEAPAMVDDMLAALDGAPGALPLLQFTAAKLWEARDRRRHVLTLASYQALGGVAGALATHADEVVQALAPAQQRLTRAIFQRLVTSDGTRALADVAELRGLAPDPGDVQSMLDHLVAARLVVVQRRGEEAESAVEIVHESLITTWPTLRRWREESAEDSAFVDQLRAAAKQWELRGRPAGLLWRGEAMEEAQRFHRRYKGQLAAREKQYLDEVIALATRSARRIRRLVGGAFALLVLLVAAAAVALLWIRDAEQAAQEQRAVAEKEAERARAAEGRIEQQLDTIRQKEAERERAAEAAAKSDQVAKLGEKKLALTYEQLAEALAKAQREGARAEAERKKVEEAARQNQRLAEAERAAKQEAERLLAQERERVRKLEDEKKRLSTRLR